MRRREFISLLGGAAAWPLAARAQSGIPAVGFLNPASPQSYARQQAAFLKGLAEAGFSDGQNVAIEYRWAEGQTDRLPAMAADLVRRNVAVIAATSTPAALAAKTATTEIPIVFETGGDPIQIGLVASLNRPGGNLTGVTQSNSEIAPKRLEILHELVPNAKIIALLVNPAEPAIAEPTTKEVQAAARTLGVEIQVLNATNDADFDGVFAKLIELGAGGLVVVAGPYFTSRAAILAALTLRHAVPTVFQNREFAAAGGLLGYGSDSTESYRLTGVYAGRILKGDKPADLPVQQAAKVELYINLRTARAFGLTVPLPLLGRADEVIE
ncbi:MAG TPA: ABC transporter substrate-binding protein [Pseudolabrys sp.]|nr:ABC transporter substrate-binding protein [Pseudolabrys sp.]